MLEEILRSVRSRLEPLLGRAASIEEAARTAPAARGFGAALRAPGLSVIAEIKRRSPSRGAIDEGLNPARLAAAYESGGASAISTLTEQDHFGGSLGDLRVVRGAVTVPVLRKDFMVHPVQVWESRAVGADAILLIAAVLDDGELDLLLDTARAAGLDALVEVHTEEEARRAGSAGAEIIGVNNRDLRTFEVDLGTAERLRTLLPSSAVAVAESGVSDPGGAARMVAAGYDAILVGEAAVRAADPAAFVDGLRRFG